MSVKETLVQLINEIGTSIGRPCFPLLLSEAQRQPDRMKFQLSHFPLHVLAVFPEESGPD